MKLVTLSGNQAAAPSRLDDPRRLSDFDAGFVILTAMAKNNSMSGWWTDLKKTAGDVGNFIADKTGSAVRLLTDKEVIEGVSRAGMAYASGGQSEAARSLFGSLGLTQGQVEQIGRDGKIQYAQMTGFGDIPKEYLLVGGGILGVVLLIMVLK